jgi:hydroxyacylglutathione hydrolase
MLHIEPLPAATDNYVWLLRRDDLPEVVVIDPGDGPAVRSSLRARHLRPVAILLTHHHADHVAGVDQVLEVADAPVWGPTSRQLVSEGDTIEITDLDLELSVIALPGHTLDHIGYVGPTFVASGDVVFAGGCGRVFEGTMAQMFHSLERIAALPRETLICCGHEYTVSNLEFAVAVEPDNPALVARLEAARKLRAHGRPTVPSTVADELATNPFLRCRERDVVEAARHRTGREVAPGGDTFAVIRRWKDGA